jgi:hypothetical protein
MRWCVLAMLSGLAGCYAPAPPAGAPCGDHDTCPAPLVCATTTHTCERTTTPADAGRDAPPDVRFDGPASDRDGDGVPDATDDCPMVADPDQRDEDGDGIGNLCDNCPATPNASQANADGDGVGDACDPEPGAPDHIALFEGFDAPLTGWTLDTGVTVSGGMLHVPRFDQALAPLTSSRGWVETSYTIAALPATTDNYRSVEVLSEVGPTGSVGGYRCGMYDDPHTAGSLNLEVQMFVSPYEINGQYQLGGNLHVNDTGHLRLAYSAQNLDCSATNPVADAASPPPETRTGAPGVFTQNLDADYAYLVVYEPGL